MEGCFGPQQTKTHFWKDCYPYFLLVLTNVVLARLPPSLLIGCPVACSDDVSADSSAEFPDRVSMMEGRLQSQEDEITLLKSSLADALRTLRVHDQLIPLLKQQLIAGRTPETAPPQVAALRVITTQCVITMFACVTLVNPAAARVLNQVCPEGCSRGRKQSSSSAPDELRHPNTRYKTVRPYQ